MAHIGIFKKRLRYARQNALDLLRHDRRRIFATKYTEETGAKDVIPIIDDKANFKVLGSRIKVVDLAFPLRLNRLHRMPLLHLPNHVLLNIPKRVLILIAPLKESVKTTIERPTGDNLT